MYLEIHRNQLKSLGKIKYYHKKSNQSENQSCSRKMQHGFLEFLWLVQFLRSSTTTYLLFTKLKKKIYLLCCEN